MFAIVFVSLISIEISVRCILYTLQNMRNKLHAHTVVLVVAYRKQSSGWHRLADFVLCCRRVLVAEATRVVALELRLEMLVAEREPLVGHRGDKVLIVE